MKRAAERLLLVSGVAGLARRRTRNRSLVLAYHNILPRHAGPGLDRSLHLPVAEFEKQLDFLLEGYRVVPLADLLEPAATGDFRPRVAITFDDAYRGAVTCGIAGLTHRGLPGTVFVAPGFIGGRSFWWDAVREPGAHPRTDAFRVRALTELAGDDAKIRYWAQGAGCTLVEPDQDCRAATVEELEHAGHQASITMASHSWSHPNLTRIEGPRLEEELRRPLEWLRSRFTATIPWLAFPYGLSDPRVAAAAAATGYAAALRVTGGWSPPRSESRYALPRWNVPAGISLDGFALRLAGLFCA